MKEIIYNYDLLNESDVNNTIQRVKALIINSNDEILLGYADKTYQFVGGHVEEGEELMPALMREIKEESGIIMNDLDLMPFFRVKYYNRNYPKEGLNTLTINNYYVVRTNLKPNNEERKLTDYEKEWNYTTKYIPKDQILDILKNSLPEAKKKNPVLDTIEAITEFLKQEGEDTRRDEWR